MIDLDGAVDKCKVWIETEQKSRKAHVCDVCYGEIKPGENYIKHFSVCDSVASEKMCLSCRDIRRSVFGSLVPVPSDMFHHFEYCEDPEDTEILQALLDKRNANIDRCNSLLASGVSITASILAEVSK